jgi:hypothetical protein
MLKIVVAPGDLVEPRTMGLYAFSAFVGSELSLLEGGQVAVEGFFGVLPLEITVRVKIFEAGVSGFH